jgi:hypothetical protein
MKVDFPDAVWGRLASIADNRGVKIADLIVEAAENVLDAKPSSQRMGPAPLVDRDDPQVVHLIRELHAMNRSVVEIAREFGVSSHAMRTALRHLNLPTSNRRTNKGATA